MTTFDETNYAPGFIHDDVEGAPFRIGQWVQFIGRCDDSIDDDGVGLIGQVLYFYYSGLTGETYPDDPLIGVDNLPHDMYWQEELRGLTDDEIKKIIQIDVPVSLKVMRMVEETHIETRYKLPD